MKIELCEDNGFMFDDGKPTLVVLIITDEQGKQARIPYQAECTIQNLYADAKRIIESPNTKFINQPKVEPFMVYPPNVRSKEPIAIDVIKSIKTNEIEREDIVTCVHLERDIDGNTNPELEIGHDYRVIDIFKQGGKITYYEVLNDIKKDMIRIPILPTEVKLKTKFIPGPPRKQVFEITKKCLCGEICALELNGDRYSGECVKCGTRMEEIRRITV